MKYFQFLNIAQDSEGTDVYLNGEIIDSNMQNLYDFFEIESVSPKSFKALLDKAQGKPLNIHINSIGGDLMAGMAMYSAIKNYKGKTTAYIDSICASAATLPAVACDKVIMQAPSTFMIHCASMWTAGNSQGLQKDVDVLKSLDNSIANAYEQKTGKPRDELLALMEEETWLDAKKAKAFGFIDEISGDVELLQPVIKNIIDSNKRLVACLRGVEHPKDPEPVQVDTSGGVGSTLIGSKYLNVEELEKAYSNLQSEYTKKCQQLAKVEICEQPKQPMNNDQKTIKARFEFIKIKTTI